MPTVPRGRIRVAYQLWRAGGVQELRQCLCRSLRRRAWDPCMGARQRAALRGIYWVSIQTVTVIYMTADAQSKDNVW